MAQRTAITIIKFVIIPVGKVFRVRKLPTCAVIKGSVAHVVFSYLNFPVRHSITNTRIELIQRLPGQLGIRQVSRRLDCAFEGGRPNLAQKGHHFYIGS
jgi:hypothetical protein